MKLIRVKAAGMFAPQEEGDCKLTLIIPKEDKEAQNFVFTNLRYQDVVIGLSGSEDKAIVQSPAEVAAQNIMHKLDDVMADVRSWVEGQLPEQTFTERTKEILNSVHDDIQEVVK